MQDSAIGFASGAMRRSLGIVLTTVYARPPLRASQSLDVVLMRTPVPVRYGSCFPAPQICREAAGGRAVSEVVSSGPVSSLVTPRFSHVLNGYLGNGLPVAPHAKARRRKAMNDTIGVDISKASLEVWRLSDRRHMRFSNDRDGLKALCQWLGSTPVRIVYEATGRFHRDLEGGTRAGQGQSLTGPPLRAGDRKHRQDRPRRRPDARAHGIDPGARADAGS